MEIGSARLTGKVGCLNASFRPSADPVVMETTSDNPNKNPSQTSAPCNKRIGSTLMKFSGQNSLMQIRQGDIEVETQMGEHYDRFTQYVWETVREVACSTEKETKTQREHDYGEKESVLSITNSYYATSTRDGKLHQKIDIDSWNHVLAQAGRDDYVDWWVDTIERADEIGDTKSIQMFKALAVLSENFCSKQHIKTHAGNTIDSAEDLAQV